MPHVRSMDPRFGLRRYCLCARNCSLLIARSLHTCPTTAENWCSCTTLSPAATPPDLSGPYGCIAPVLAAFENGSLAAQQNLACIRLKRAHQRRRLQKSRSQAHRRGHPRTAPSSPHSIAPARPAVRSAARPVNKLNFPSSAVSLASLFEKQHLWEFWVGEPHQQSTRALKSFMQLKHWVGCCS
jgi:hypothetical protein